MPLARVAREVVEDVLAVPLDEHLLRPPDYRPLMQAHHLRSLVRRLAEDDRAGAVPGGFEWQRRHPERGRDTEPQMVEERRREAHEIHGLDDAAWRGSAGKADQKRDANGGFEQRHAVAVHPMLAELLAVVRRHD